MKTIIVVALLLFPMLLSAQSLEQRLKGLVKNVSSSTLSYDYRVVLKDQKTGVIADSITGKYYRNGRSFVDSSNLAYSMLAEGYYCKLEFEKKQANIYDIKVLGKKLGLQVEKDPAIIPLFPDSSLVSYSTLTTDTSGGFYRLNWKMGTPAESSFTLVFEKKTYDLKEIIIKTHERDGYNYDYEKLYEIHNISSTVDPARFILGNIVGIANGSATLKGKYAHYKLNTLLN